MTWPLRAPTRGMRAGQADQQAGVRNGAGVAQHAEDLGFLAAHHVGQAVALDQAGHDVDGRGAGSLDHGQQRADAVQGHRHVEVGGFLPALGAADHAAGDHGQRGLGSQPVAASLFEGQFEAGQGRRGGAVLQRLRQAHDAPGQVARVQRAAGAVQAVGAQRGRAPVQRDQGGAGGRGGCHLSLSRVWPRRLGKPQGGRGPCCVQAGTRARGGGRALGKILDQRLKILKI